MNVIADNRAAALAALADPVRRRIYDVVVHSADAVGRDAAAAAAAVPRSTAAFHLDRLVDAGLLEVEYRRLSGRTGPGAGRPAKLYHATVSEVIGSFPERHYEIAGELLASAAERADRDGTSMSAAVATEARELGESIGRESPSVEEALTACGYEPRSNGCGGVMLGNCPFHALATRHTELVCTANLALVRGMMAGVGDSRAPQLIPRDGHCCVEIRAQDAASGDTAEREHPTSA
ncbi:helix-turn-helix domain-containing protein [Microbacterium kribbense]|uniref:Helix-turn-helix domain-containing protein n=1 Tax=Microbacterium kribbense TaxID=433645 RepID=A0ABP7G9X6_9MICO